MCPNQTRNMNILIYSLTPQIGKSSKVHFFVLSDRQDCCVDTLMDRPIGCATMVPSLLFLRLLDDGVVDRSKSGGGDFSMRHVI